MAGVNIVSKDLEDDKILGRLARTLAAQTGWSLSPNPNTKALLNVFICYIEYAERYSDWHKTPVAAWFTHFEKGTAFKEFWWGEAARHVDLRLTSARQYVPLLEKYGTTALVTPPVERLFQLPPTSRVRGALPVVGVSGFVDPNSPRKGEALVQALATGQMADKIILRATGVGWPVTGTRTRNVSELPAFYYGLDVYLCSSLIEGIPLPPLEALACGVPVVVPKGVGLLDDLTGPGVYRYRVGNYGSMEKALALALTELDTLDRAALPGLVTPYTPEAWGQGFLDAVEQWKGGGLEVARERVKTETVDTHHGAKGAYFVAYGSKARQCAVGAMASFKKHMPGVQVALAAVETLGVEDVLLPLPDEDIGGRTAKLRAYEVTPPEWEYVVYLDADTQTVGDLSFFYKILLDGWDMFICRNPDKYHVARRMVRPDNKDECAETFRLLGTDELLQLNGGVFGFQRNDRTRAFFTAWLAEWRRWGKRDQAALLRALWAHPVKLYVLGNEWNTITRYADASTTAGLLHFPLTARRWRDIVPGPLTGPEAWAAVRRFEEGGAK